jgi:hypothetical protein
MGWFVDARAFGIDPSARATERTDEQGGFVSRNCPDVDHVLGLQWPHKKAFTQVAESQLVRPGGDQVVFVVSVGMIPSASLVGTLLDNNGAPVADLHVSAKDELGRRQGRGTYGSDGRFQIELLGAGTYTLSCNSNLLAEEVLGRFELKPDEVLDVGTLRLSARGFLEVTMRRSDGAVLSGPMSRVVDKDWVQISLGADTTEDGVRFRTRALAPGRYFIYPYLANAGGPMREVEVRAGETTSLDMQLEPAARRVLRFRVPPRAEPPKVLNVKIVDANGATFLESEGRFLDRDHAGLWTHFLFSSFPVGSYSFVAKSAEGFGACGSFEIAEPEEPYEGIDVDLTKQP